MIKALIIFAALFSGEAKEAVTVDASKSTITWTGGKVIGGSHTGTIALKSGSLDMDGAKLKGGSFIIDMSTLACSDLDGSMKEKLEGHLKSDDFFGVAANPTAEFKITKVKSVGSNKYNVTGDITIKGKTESVSFETIVAEAGNSYEATASITVDRTKFDVRYGSDSFFDNLGDKAIKDEFTLEVKLVAGK